MRVRKPAEAARGERESEKRGKSILPSGDFLCALVLAQKLRLLRQSMTAMTHRLLTLTSVLLSRRWLIKLKSLSYVQELLNWSSVWRSLKANLEQRAQPHLP